MRTKSFGMIGSVFLSLLAKGQDTLSIHQFDSLVNKYYNKMQAVHQAQDTLSLGDFINIIKLDNTILKKETAKEIAPYLPFARYFHTYFIATAIKMIGGEITNGFGYYSAKYDILLGDTLMHNRSYYYLNKQ